MREDGGRKVAVVFWGLGLKAVGWGACMTADRPLQPFGGLKLSGSITSVTRRSFVPPKARRTGSARGLAGRPIKID